MLAAIDERAAAFRAGVAAAPGLDTPVETSPGWTLFELARHLGQEHRFRAAAAAAGPADRWPARREWEDPDAPSEWQELLAWTSTATDKVLGELRAAGPDRGCWRLREPRTCDAAARELLHQTALWAYDAQAAVGVPQPVPAEVALDAIGTHLTQWHATTTPWPHEPATIEYRTDEGPAWRVRLCADGVKAALTTVTSNADAVARGPATDVFLALNGRQPLDGLALDGDATLFDRRRFWPRPERRGTTLADRMPDWTDWDGAAHELGRSLGLAEDSLPKWVFWTANPLGDGLHDALLALVRAGVLERRDEPDEQFRWNPTRPE